MGEAKNKRERNRIIAKYKLQPLRMRNLEEQSKQFDIIIHIAGSFDKDPSSTGVTRALIDTYRRYGDFASRLPVEHVEGRVRLKLACAPGCSHCCVTSVSIIAPEALLMADFIRTNFSAEERDDLMSRIEQHGRATASGGRPLCPLNLNGLCSVYPVRPFNCRKFHSFELAACYKYFVIDSETSNVGNIPRDFHRADMSGLFWGALDAGFTSVGIDTRDLALVPSLGRAMATDAGPRLLAGEPVFLGTDYES